MKRLIYYLLVLLLVLSSGCSKENNNNHQEEDPFKYLVGEWNIVQRNSTYYFNGEFEEEYENISPTEINLILEFTTDGDIYYTVPTESELFGGWTIDRNDSLFIVMAQEQEMTSDLTPEVEVTELTETSFHLILTYEWTSDENRIKSIVEYIMNKEFSDFLVMDNVWEKQDLSTNLRGSSLWAVGSGSKIYMGNASNSGQYDQWFASFDTEGGQVQSLTTNGEICACGYGSFLHSYDGELYYFANDGVKYSPGSDSWSTLYYPYEIKRGEAPSALLDGDIYYLGGRTETTIGQYYDIDQDSWTNLSDEMDYFVHYNYATANAYDHKLYVIGGDGYNEKQVSEYDPLTGLWSRKSDSPYQTGRYSVAYKGRIYITGGYGMYTYDPSSDTWGEGYVWPEGGLRSEIIVIAGSELYVIGYNYNTIEIYKFNY